MKRLLASAAAVGLALTGCSLLPSGGSTSAAPSRTSAAAPSATTTYDPALARFYTQRLAWTGCDENQCASLTVPVDYAKPDGATLKVSVLKAPSVSRKKKGALVVNPGGPGGSGVDYAAGSPSYFSGPLTRAYDVVGFDPRGVGRSQPVVCYDGPQFDRFLGLDPTPDDASEQQALKSGDAAFGAACQERNGELLAHVSTEDVARDMDVLRAALGENRLTYFGASYGTFLGATYADLFPRNVGRMVLDGAMDPKMTGEELVAGQAGGFETAFDSFVKDCVERGGCPLGPTVPAAQQRTRELLAQLDARPLPTNGVGPDGGLTESWASYGIAAALYDQGSWPVLRTALEQALEGKGEMLMRLAVEYTGRQDDGTYNSNMLQVINAVNCLDRGAPADPAHYVGLQREYAAKWPTFGPFMAWSGLVCGTWPVKATGKAHAITAPGSAPIVVVGTTRDPATPYEEAVSLARQLENGRLVTRDGDGHTGYQKGNACVDRAVDGYLIDGRVPAEDTRC